MTEGTIVVLFFLFVAALGLLVSTRAKLSDTEQWLRDELTAHEKTRQHLREAASRMRRENRERALGIIESQRAE